MLKIRLMRIGAKKKPFYRVVAVEQRSKRTGGYLELLGTYDPLTTPHDIKLKQDRIDHWIKQGAQPSVGYLRIIGKAPQRLPRKAKKEKKEAAPATPAAPQEDGATPAAEPEAPAVEETPVEGPVEEVTPAEEPKEEVKTEEATPAPAEETPAQEEQPAKEEPEQSTEEK